MQNQTSALGQRRIKSIKIVQNQTDASGAQSTRVGGIGMIGQMQA